MKTFLLRLSTLLCATFFTVISIAQPGRVDNGPMCKLNFISDVTVPADPGKQGAVVTFPSPNANNPCGAINYTPASGTLFPVGVTNVTAVAATGGVTKVFTVTVLDAEPPRIECPAAIFTTTDAGTCGAVISDLGTPTVTDNGTVTVTSTRNDGQPLNASFPKGATTITWTAQDAAGNTSTCTQLVVVSDKEAPVIAPPFAGGAITKSTDADVCSYTVKGTELDASATDNCAGPVTIAYTWTGASAGSTTNSLAGVVFEKGTTTVWCTATDASGNAAEWIFAITVADNQAPVINSVTATPDVLWSPNHKMVDITLTYDVTENCSGLTYQIVSITSNEPTNDLGDGNTDVDWNEGTDGQHIQLRAERSGKGNGRIYTITVKVKDAAGNESGEAIVTVSVAHDQGKKEGVADANALDVTVAPNPSNHSFTFKTSSVNTSDKITMVVSDSMGRPVYRKSGITPGQTITMGSDLRPGTYYVAFQQAGTTTQQRVIKVQ